MTSVQITMVAACLAVVSCEPPVISQSYGVPADSYSPSYSSGGYGGGGGGYDGGHHGGHHGGHETVGRGGADSSPEDTRVVSCGGSDSSEQTGGGSSDKRTRSGSSGKGCPGGVDSGGSGDVRHPVSWNPVAGDQKALSDSQLEVTTLLERNGFGETDIPSGAGNNVGDGESTLSPDQGLGLVTTIGGNEDDVNYKVETGSSSQIRPSSCGSIACTEGSKSEENNCNNTNSVECAVNKTNPQSGGDPFISESENTYYLEGSFTSSPGQDKIFLRRLNGDGISREIPTESPLGRSQPPDCTSYKMDKTVSGSKKSDDKYSGINTGYEYSPPPTPWDGVTRSNGSNYVGEQRNYNSVQDISLNTDNGLPQTQNGDSPYLGTRMQRYDNSWQEYNNDNYGKPPPGHSNNVNPEHSTYTIPCPLFPNMVRGSALKDYKKTSSWQMRKGLEHSGVQPSYTTNSKTIGDEVTYDSKQFQNSVNENNPLYVSTFRGHFIVADKPNIAEPVCNQDTSASSRYYDNNYRQGRAIINSWNVPHPNELLEPPNLSVPPWKPKTGIEGYPGYGRGGYRVKEEDSNSRDHNGNQGAQGASGFEGNVATYYSDSRVGGFDTRQAWKGDRERTPNQVPSYKPSSNGFINNQGETSRSYSPQPYPWNYNLNSGVDKGQTNYNTGGYGNFQALAQSNNRDSHTTVENQPPLGADGNQGHSFAGGYHSNKSGGYGQHDKFGSVGYEGHQGGWYGTHNEGSNTPVNKQRAPGTGGYLGYGSGGGAHGTSSSRFGEAAAFGSEDYANQRGGVHNSNQGSATQTDKQVSTGTGDYQGYSNFGGVSYRTSSKGLGHEVAFGSVSDENQRVGENIYNPGSTTPIYNQAYGSEGVSYTTSSGFNQPVKVGSVGNSNQRGGVYGYNQWSTTPLDKSTNPPWTNQGNHSFQGYSSRGVYTNSSTGYGQATSFGSRDHIHQRAGGDSYNEGFPTLAGKPVSPGTGSYQGYGSGGVSFTNGSNGFEHVASFGSGGIASQNGGGYNYNQGTTQDSKPVPPGTGGYQGYGSRGVTYTTSTSGYGQGIAFGSGGHANQKGGGFEYNQGSTTSGSKPLSWGTGGFQGYGSGGESQTSSVNGFGKASSFGSGSITSQYVGGGSQSYDQGSSTPSSKPVYSGTSGYQGYGSGGGYTTSSSGYGQGAAFASEGHVYQKGGGYEYNKGSTTSNSTPVSWGTGGYQGFGSGEAFHTSNINGFGQASAFGSGGVTSQNGGGGSQSYNQGSTTPSTKPVYSGNSGNQGGGYTTSSSGYGQVAAFGSEGHANQQGGGFGYNQGSTTSDSKQVYWGTGGYQGYGSGGMSLTGGVNGFGKPAELPHQSSTSETGGYSGSGTGGNGGGYGGTVWKDVGGWKNFTVRPAGFLGYGLSSKPYQFGYAVNDQHSGADFRQQEQSDGNTVKGQYRVALPDGRTQIVTYTADWQTGFHADVQYEGEASYPAVWGGSGGYAPSGSYGAPSSNYGAPSTSYGSPSSSYGVPGGTGSQYSNIGHSSGGHGHGGYKK